MPKLNAGDLDIDAMADLDIVADLDLMFYVTENDIYRLHYLVFENVLVAHVP